MAMGKDPKSYADYSPQDKTIHLCARRSNLEIRRENDNKMYRQKYITKIPYHSTTTLEGVIYHELAHALDYNNNLKYRKAIEALSTKVKEQIEQVSLYARSNLYKSNVLHEKCNEAFAECFAEYLANSDRNTFIPDEVRTLIKETFNV